jgi:hypothetical protein
VRVSPAGLSQVPSELQMLASGGLVIFKLPVHAHRSFNLSTFISRRSFDILLWLQRAADRIRTATARAWLEEPRPEGYTVHRTHVF